MRAEKAFFVDRDNKNHWKEYINQNNFVMLEYDFAYSWRYTLAIDKKLDPNKAVAMGEQLGKALHDDYSTKVLIARLKNVALSILIAAAIYAFGWTLGWIYRGFKEPR
jgi:hypothetical protein